jgi:hypothetical protein
MYVYIHTHINVEFGWLLCLVSQFAPDIMHVFVKALCYISVYYSVHDHTWKQTGGSHLAPGPPDTVCETT